MLSALEQRIVIGAVGALLGLFLALQASDLFGNPGHSLDQRPARS